MLKRIRTVVLAVFVVSVAAGAQQGLFAAVTMDEGCVPTNVGAGVGWVDCTDESTDCQQVDDPFCSQLCSTYPGWGTGWAGSCDDGVGFTCACAPGS